MGEFLGEDERSFIVDTSFAGSLGPTPGLLLADEAIPLAFEAADGVVLNPGQLERISKLLPGKTGAAPLVRVDWTNAFRDKTFILPAEKVCRAQIAGAEAALELGAAAAVVTLLMGFDDEFESQNIGFAARIFREGSRINLPVLVDIHLMGPKIGADNFAGALGLSTAMMVEGGADALIMPYPGEEMFAQIQEFSPVPIFLRESARVVSDPALSRKLLASIDSGAAGLLLGQDAFACGDPRGVFAEARSLVHGAREAELP